MGDVYYKDGVNAGRQGSDPSPPRHNALDSLMAISEKAVKEMADDYREGYAAGSQQRVADELKRKEAD